MNRIPLVVAAVAALSLAACNPFRNPLRQAPVVDLGSVDPNVNARWSGTLASPADLAGALQMKGSVSMTPGSHGGETRVRVDLANATPGGAHPWQLHRGACGADEGTFGSAESYRTMNVDDEGRSSSTATVPLAMPTTGRYYVSLGASVANPSMIVACANLAPPSR